MYSVCVYTQCKCTCVYNGTSEQGARLGQCKFTCYDIVLCREVVLFSEVLGVLKLTIGTVTL